MNEHGQVCRVLQTGVIESASRPADGCTGGGRSPPPPGRRLQDRVGAAQRACE